GDIVVGGRRGFVTGGEIRSGSMISVKTAGSQMGTSTLLEVGIDPRILEEFRELEKKLASMIFDKERLVQALVMFRKKLTMGVQITEEKKEYLKQVTQNNIMLETQIKESRKRYDELKIEMDNNSSGVIKVSDIVFPGTKLVISNVIHFVREETHHSKFVRDRADIKVVPL
ncbi:MAG: FapA family protein, partial [Mobilitalea sp.]